MRLAKLGIAATLFSLASFCAGTEPLPEAIVRQLPQGYEAIMVKTGDFNEDQAKDYLVVVGMKSEKQIVGSGKPAPNRRLLAFIQAGPDNYTLVGENEEVAFAADQAFQCDPLLDSGGIATKGSYFTVENDAACGEHWSDFITFKYDKNRRRFFFHKRIVEVWELNTSTGPDAQALVLRNRKVTSANRSKPIALNAYVAQ
jgi:hypothetical protein